MNDSEPIAIVGIGCRFPGGVTSPDELWSLLEAGRDAIGPIPDDRHAWGWGGAPPYGGFIDDVFGFDPAFFGWSPREAEATDPQHRLLLETTREAMEDALVRPSALASSRVGVFIGLFATDYASRRDGLGMLDYLGTGRSGAAGRIAYEFDLRGPSLVIDTDRSSGLVALHDACASLRAGDCEAAIVGAASVLLDPRVSAAFHQAGMLAADGRCKFADARADGFVRSEGVAAILLMPLGRALRERARIYAVVRGSAVAASGRLADDLMAQSPEAQESLLSLAYARAGISPRELTYLEAHGTGTPRGDEVELEALARVLRASGRATPCWVGSIKTNIGHCEPCAGLAGVIKVALAAWHGELPPTLHFRRFPERVQVDSVLRVPCESIPVAQASFLAGVSAFGLTGINAHVVLASAPKVAPLAQPPATDGAPVLCLSANGEVSLGKMALRYAEMLARSKASLSDVCRSAALHRDHLRQRATIVARTRDEAISQLEAFAKRGAQDGAFVSGARAWSEGDKLVFVFPGQGSQWVGMCSKLLKESPAFARKMAECDDAFRSLTDWSLLAELESARRFEQIEVIQPLLVAIEISLAEMWRSWGIRPSAVVGTSMGEVAAAHVCGALSLRDALHIIVARTRLMQTLRGGAMAVVELPAERVLARLDPSIVSIAAINSPTSTTISGERHAVARLVGEFEHEGVFARIVRVDVASHSPQMDAILEPLRAQLEGLSPDVASVPMFSTVYGRYVAGSELVADYWVRNLRDPVNLARAVRTLVAERATIFLEVSPHPILRAPILDGVAAAEGECLVAFSLERDADELRTARTSLGRLHVFGFPVPWERSLGEGAPVCLPGYAWANVPLGAEFDSDSRTAANPSRPEPRLTARSEQVAADASLVQRLLAAPPPARTRALLDALSHELSRVLRIPASEVQVDLPLREHGLTSASATELRVTIGGWLGKRYPSSLVFDHPTIRLLAAHLAHELEPKSTSESSAAVAERPVSTHEPLAIVGMAFRFPGGVRCAESFWKLLIEGGDAVTEIPRDRWDAARYYDPDVQAKGKMRTKWGGFVDDIAQFDADFFGISPKEAESMDPRQRILLELAWEALEDAGSSRTRAMGTSMGVFVGIMNNNEYAARRSGVDSVAPHSSTGEATSIAAGRISYFFGLHGPALAIDTACSSSLVALHLAAQSIRRGECEAAFVAGANLIAHPSTTLAFAKTRMLSPTGRCKTFDASADGYVRGEGACVVVVKPVSKALAEGDRILAIVRGTAVNHDGRGSGLTVPNAKAQEALLRQALADAGVSAEEVSYIEAHGTGTSLGDPIEVDAIVNTFAKSRTAAIPLAVGAVKANIGHLEACAGLGGLVKVVIAMRERTIPRQIHLNSLNPKITSPDWLVFPRDNLPWDPPSKKRVAGVSSFGFSGTNAHAILEEAPSVAHRPVTSSASSASSRMAVLPISALTPHALSIMARRYVESPQLAFPHDHASGVAASAGRREHLPVRAAAVAETVEEMRRQLEALADGGRRTGLLVPPSSLADAPVVAFVYGDGDVSVPAVTDLYANEPRFRDAVECCAEASGIVLDRMFKGLGPPASAKERTATHFAAQYALTMLLADLGIVPEYATGEGVGDFVAGHAAGILDLQTALALALGRRTTSVPTTRPRLSFVPGRAAPGDPYDAAYWVGEGPSRLDDAWRALAAAGCSVFVGIGAPSLARSREAAGSLPAECVAFLGTETFAVTIARLFTSGVNVNWQKFYAGRTGRYEPLPPYAFARRTYWRSCDDQ